MRHGYGDDQLTGAFDGERVFRSKADLRYVLETATDRPDALVVGFSAASPPGEPPRYYTIRAMRETPCHRLFVLDDHGPPRTPTRSSWYLGRNRDTEVPDSVCELMSEVADEMGVPRRRVFTCGASKGGWASLYFGARFGAGHAIAGEPQVLLGEHLMQDENYDIAAHVAGGTASSDKDYLNELLYAAFQQSEFPPHVHLYCGRGSSYYARDVVPLVGWLDELGIPNELDLGDHSDHVPDLGQHFPAYLTGRLAALLTGTREAA